MQATRDDFLKSGWETVIARSNDKECNYYMSHLWQRAREAKDTNDPKTEELFRLLGDICSLNLKLDSPEQPYVTNEEKYDSTHIPFQYLWSQGLIPGYCCAVSNESQLTLVIHCDGSLDNRRIRYSVS